MLGSLIRTRDSVVPALARLALGVVILPHGLQKAFGLFGGHGFGNTVAFLDGTFGVPPLLGALVVLVELVGGVALIVGALGRIAAAAIAANMLGAALLVHRGQFFMNWDGSAAGEGFEFHILALALAAIVVIAGSGRWSIDHAVAPSRSTH